MTGRRPMRRSALAAWPRSCGPIALGALLAALASLVAPGCVAGDWRVAAADARVGLSVRGDLFSRDRVDSEARLDFNALLGTERVLAFASLALLEASTGDAVMIEAAEDAEIRYASGNPVLRLRWPSGPLAPFAERSWHLYCRTVGRGEATAWRPLATTFVPTSPDVLLDTGFEEADPAHADRPEFMQPGGRDLDGEHTDRVWTRETAHSGQRALKIARTFAGAPPANSNRPFWWTWPPPLAVKAGQSVGVSGWLKTARLDPGAGAALLIEFRNTEGARIPGGHVRLPAPTVPHDWRLLSRSATAPAGAAHAVIWFSLHGGGEAYCDDLTVTRIAGGDLPGLPVLIGPLENRAAFAPESDERPEGGTLACSLAASPPVLDGTLDDACWKGAGRITDFRVHRQVPGTRAATTVLACADRQALYVGFECSEMDTTGLRAKATTRDGRLWEDDSVELFLDTNRDLRTYYQVIVNSRGVFFDQDTGVPGLPGAAWDGPISAAAHVFADRWTAEVRIAFTGLRLADAEGRVWGANFARTSLRGGRSLYVWSPVTSNFGEPQHFGRLVLPFDPSARVVAGRPLAGDTVFWGDGFLDFEVVNRREEAVPVRVTATAESAAGQRLLGTEQAVVQARATTVLQVPAAFPEPGEVRIRYELTETASGTLLYRTSVTHRVPPPLGTEPSALVSYLGEPFVRGTWSLGMADEQMHGLRLAFALVPEGADQPVATAEILPTAASGAFAVPADALPPGVGALQVRLWRGTATLATTVHPIERAAGPFSPGPR